MTFMKPINNKIMISFLIHLQAQREPLQPQLLKLQLAVVTLKLTESAHLEVAVSHHCLKPAWTVCPPIVLSAFTFSSSPFTFYPHTFINAGGTWKNPWTVSAVSVVAVLGSIVGVVFLTINFVSLAFYLHKIF